MDNTLVYEAGNCGSIPYRRTSLSRIRLAAIPLRLGRRHRRFESYMRDQFYALVV